MHAPNQSGLTAQWATLASLGDGWLDGEGAALDKF